MHGVILDADSLGPADLDLEPLLGCFDSCSVHASTLPAEVGARIRDADVVLSNKVMLGAGHFAASPRLQLVAVMATGTDNIDLEAARAHGVAVANARAYASTSVAEHTLLLMLALSRSLVPNLEAARDGTWSRSRFFCIHAHPVRELGGARLGIVGYGELGAAVAQRAAALGMDIRLAALAHRAAAAREAPWPRMPFKELLGWADVLSLHCPLSADTRHLIGAAELAAMQPHALLVNTARGALVDASALSAALRAGTIAGAALDTLDGEPPPADHPLLDAGLPNLLITPHIAWAARGARRALLEQLADIVRGFRAGSVPNRIV